MLTIEDVSNIRHIADRTLRNAEVLKYLKYLKEEQIPDHNSFSDAVFLFEQMFGKKDDAYPQIVKYLKVAPTMTWRQRLFKPPQALSPSG